MARLMCRCLNVSVHVKTENWQSRPVAGRLVFPSHHHRLHDVTLHETTLASPGISSEHESLLLSEKEDDWLMKKCSNCQCDVVVCHSQKNRILLCPHLLSTNEEIAQVKGHPNYSKIFRISLNPDLEEEEEERQGRPRASSVSFGRSDPVIKQLHSQMKIYLANEEESLELRIREFERRERDNYERLQRRTHTQRTLLFSAIAKARRGVSSVSNSTSSQQQRQQPSLPPHNNKQRVTITLSDPRPSATEGVGGDDALFSLDGFDVENEMEEEEEEEVDGGKLAFPQSDDEESGTDDSSYRDMSSVQAVVASSVPLTIPLFPPQTQPPEEEERREPGGDMASSIKALALSVQNTGMFGDLPRPRVNSATRFK